jgi:ribonucleoside-diphosphate reductase alpha chain
MAALTLQRFWTTKDTPVEEQFGWAQFTIKGFSQPIEAPEGWSETAVEIAATKYMRRKHETSVRQLVSRVVNCVRQAAEWQGYFSTEQAQIFADELKYLLLSQAASFNSPVYFNVGVFAQYGQMGNAETFVFDTDKKQVVPMSSAYIRPQASACFIQSVQDDLLSIFELLKNEAKLFKFGSGTGTNFSTLRAKGEVLDSGGESTGLIPYLEVFDKAAQAIKSGGTTRRAAKMVVLDADHPEVLEFVRWKMMEERKARILMANGVSGGMEGEAFRTISGQNSNNSIRLTDDFMNRALNQQPWPLKARRNGEILTTLNAADLLREMARAAWECADPGVQFHDTIQAWHMCPQDGTIRSSNPCSEYMFLDDSACNLASLNLVKFRAGKGIDWAALKSAVRLMLIAQDVLVDYASYPTKKIAENSHRFRPLGLGYANLGGLLMRMGLAYDSQAARALAAEVSAGIHAVALETSVQMAESLGAFAGWKENASAAQAVLTKHAKAWSGSADWIAQTFQRVLSGSVQFGLRNAQVTLIAPTGTIGLFMDCDTLGIEPDFALIKIKTLAGGGSLRLVNRSLTEGLRSLGYTPAQIAEIEQHVQLEGTVVGAPSMQPQHFAVFDTAVPPTGLPDRRVSAEGHLQMMACVQPFLSGAISKTVNLPASTNVEDIEQLFVRAWKLGLKSVAVYRDGSKSLQPLCAEC